MRTFADRIIAFNRKLHYQGELPAGVKIMNPFRESKQALAISTAFYKKFYNDTEERHIIIGINPGRFGAGLTGVPFTDTKRLSGDCGIEFDDVHTHEPSATFVYEVIREMGGPKKFYGKFYIQSICPLGFTIQNKLGRAVNYNYYDSKELTEAVYPFIMKNMRQQIKMGLNKNLAFCFGTGKNIKFLEKLNAEHHFFKEIVPLEHPRYIMQYRFKTKDAYVDKYVNALGRALEN